MKRWTCAFLATALLAVAVSGSEKDGTFRREFADVGSLELDSLFVRARVEAVTGSTLRLEARDIPKGVRVETRQLGSKVIIKVEKDDFLPVIAPGAAISVFVPVGADCELSSASGSIEISGLAGKILSVKSASGSVSASALGTPVSIETASGSVKVEKSAYGKVIKSASGSIEIKGGEGDIIASSASGEIRVSGVGGIARLSTASGGVEIDSFKGRLKVETTSGSIRGRDVVLSGDSDFRSVSGSIDLDLDNRKDDFRYSVTTTSGSTSVFGDSVKGDFGSGSINLSARTTSGSVRVR